MSLRAFPLALPVLARACAIAIALVGPAQAAETNACTERFTLTRLQLESIDPEQAYRLRIGMSESEMLAFLKRRGVDVQEVSTDRPEPYRAWDKEYGIGRPGTQGQFAYVADGRLVAIAQYAEDEQGLALETTADETRGMLDDARQFLCWRFGSWHPELAATDLWLTTLMMGPRRIIGEVHGRDDELAFDVWVAKEPEADVHYVMYMVREPGLMERAE